MYTFRTAKIWRSERPNLKKMFIWKPVMESPVEGHMGCRLSSKPLFLTSQGRKGLGREKCLHVALRGNKDWAWNAVLEAHLTAEGAAKGRDVRSGMHWDPAVRSSGYSRGSLDKRLEKKIEMYPWNCAVFSKVIASFTDTSSIWQLTMIFNSIINNFDFMSPDMIPPISYDNPKLVSLMCLPMALWNWNFWGCLSFKASIVKASNKLPLPFKIHGVIWFTGRPVLHFYNRACNEFHFQSNWWHEAVVSSFCEIADTILCG